jgi:hypothetical protein
MIPPYVEKETGIHQYGFHQGKSTIDQMFAPRQILEKCREFSTLCKTLITPVLLDLVLKENRRTNVKCI